MATDDPIDDADILEDESEDALEDESEDTSDIANDEGLDESDEEPVIPELDDAKKHTEATMPPGVGRDPSRNTM